MIFNYWIKANFSDVTLDVSDKAKKIVYRRYSRKTVYI